MHFQTIFFCNFGRTGTFEKQRGVEKAAPEGKCLFLRKLLIVKHRRLLPISSHVCFPFSLSPKCAQFVNIGHCLFGAGARGAPRYFGGRLRVALSGLCGVQCSVPHSDVRVLQSTGSTFQTTVERECAFFFFGKVRLRLLSRRRPRRSNLQGNSGAPAAR